MIVNRKDMESSRIEIDLACPAGNSYALLGMAEDFAVNLGYTAQETSELLADMQSSNYENLLQVFDEHFGHFVTLIKD